jgi:hypothetical protein
MEGLTKQQVKVSFFWPFGIDFFSHGKPLQVDGRLFLDF